MRHGRVRLWSEIGAAILCVGLIVSDSPRGTPPPEVQNQRFVSTTTQQWDPTPGATGYNLYRGLISALPGSYGLCLQPNLPSTFATDAAVPPTGACYQYLVTAFNGSGEEGTFGFPTVGPERPNTNPCPSSTVVLHDTIHPDGPAPDGVTLGVEAPRNPAVANDLTGLIGGGLYLQTGEYFAQVVDLEIPGRGMNWRMTRTYRSQINHNGQIGYNWSHNYDRRIYAVGPDLFYLDGEGREDRYVPVGGALYEPALAGIYAKIRFNIDGSYSMRDRDGTVYRHHALDASPLSGVLVSIENRLRDHMTLLYNPSGQLVTVVDTLGRSISYFWGPTGRLSRVQDYTGRQVVYQYDANGNLVTVTRPAVTGTSNGNDFPAGKTTTYTYSSGTGNPQLDHNLLTITAPGDSVPVVQNNYNPNDELQTQFYGGTNTSGIPAGGVYQLTIAPLGGGLRRATLLDRANIQHVIECDADGHATKEQILTIGLRPGDPAVFETRHSYNAQGERISTQFPLSNQILYAYDSGNVDRFQRGNLTAVFRVADPARGDGFGGALPTISAAYQYEPFGTQQRIITDPLVHQSIYTYDYQEATGAASGMTAYASAWQINTGGIALGLGDINGDGLIEPCTAFDPAAAFGCGNPVSLQQPTVNLLTGGKQAGVEGGTTQPIVTLYRYNAQHQIRVEVEPELNVKTSTYWPETDPDGDGVTTPPPADGRVLDNSTGGYLRINVLDDDPTPHLSPAQIARRNNATNPPATAIRNDYAYDARGNMIASIDGNGVQTAFEINALGQIVSVRRGQISFRSIDTDPGIPPLGYVSYQFFNARDEIIRRRVQDPVLSDSFFDVFITLDILGNVVTQAQDVSNVQTATTQYRYDAQGRRTQLVFPEGNINTIQYDERALPYHLVRGDNDGNAGNGGPVGSSSNTFNYDQNGNPSQFVDGRGIAWNFVYDGMDRRVRAPVALSGTPSFFDIFYNADESISSIKVRTAALTLYDAFYLYDELGRTKEARQGIRNSGGAFILGEDQNNDGYASQLFEYDRNSRRTRTVADLGQRHDFDYDGAGHVVRTVDPLMNQASLVYDANNNVLGTTELEHGPTGDETRSTSNTYDRLNRKLTATDASGQVHSFVYDSRDMLTQLVDAYQNTTNYEYDARGNRTRVVRDMRAGGHGPGPIVDTIAYRTDYDRNGRVTAMVDPLNHTTSYQYDTLDRKVKDLFDDGTSITYGYDPNDNLQAVTDANGSVITIPYDTNSRPSGKNVAPAAGVHPNQVTYVYDSMNRLVTIQDQNDGGVAERTILGFQYDSLNRIRNETSSYGSNPVKSLSFTYDGNGNRRTGSMVGDSIQWFYDPLDRVTSIQAPISGFSTLYSYLGTERVGERRNSNNTRKSYLDSTGTIDIGYDQVKRTKSIRHYLGAGTVLAGFNYTYDPEGNITSETRPHHFNRGDTFVYDSAYRLFDFKRDVDNPAAEASVPGSGGLIRHRVEYTLDKVGNWLNHRIDGGALLGNTPNNLNEYDENQSGGTRVDDGIANDFGDNTGTPGPDGINLGHDKNGDLTKEGTTKTYEYDCYHRLVTVRTSGVVSAHYVYDGLNRRIVKQNVATGVRSRFVYDGDKISHEFDLSAANVEGALKRRFYSGPDNPIIALQNVAIGQLIYLHEDERHSSIMATNSAGTVMERVTYDAYGVPQFQDAANNPIAATESTIGNPFLYQGRYYDPETQFYESRGAIFAPRFGRHVQRFVPGQMVGPQVLAYQPPMVFPVPIAWIGMHPFWWCKNWFWHPCIWWGGWWAWRPFWWWGGGVWGWWRWQPWVWFVGGGYDWWVLRPWWGWWGAPFRWWGWQAWWGWGGWWGWWPWWGWGGWGGWLPAWGWLGWVNWWPWWGWGGWCGWWLGFGWWGWCGWWPWWNGWWGWHPWWWNGWWTWCPWWWFGYWGWAGVTWWWNWWFWIAWRPWKWWIWFGWGWWWGWWGWNPWWWCGWWGWWWWGWNWGWYWWWGPLCWNPWWWGWHPWWLMGWWWWGWPWAWWAWGWWGWWPVWWWGGWWGAWWWLRWGFGWWGWGRWWGWWWPWWWWW